MARPRAAVFRLRNGWYLGRDGNSTQYAGVPVVFRLEDALKVRAALRTRDWNDPLQGMSMELLPKRTNPPLSEVEAAAFLVAMKTVRLLQEADRYDRLAEGYVAQARHAEQQAEAMRNKALELRNNIGTVKG